MGSAARRQRASPPKPPGPRRTASPRHSPPPRPPPATAQAAAGRPRGGRGADAERAARAARGRRRPAPGLAEAAAARRAARRRPRPRSRPSARRSSLDLLAGHRARAPARRPARPQPPRPHRRRRTEPIPEPNRTPPPAPHLALRRAIRAYPAGSGTPERSPSGTPGRSDWGVVARLIVQAKKLSRFLFPGPRQLAYIRKVRASGLFDPDFYTTHHPGMRWIFRRFPVRHYVTIGEREYLRPNPDFSASIYLRYNPDVRHGRRPALPALRRDRPPRAQGRPRSCPSRCPASPARCRGSATAGAPPPTSRWWRMSSTMTSGTRSPTGSPAPASPSTSSSPITDKGAETDALIPRIPARFPRARTLRYPNRGRDVLPFVHLVNAGVLDGYQAVCKIHTKRSPHRDGRRPLAAPPDRPASCPRAAPPRRSPASSPMPGGGDLGRRRPALPLARLVGLEPRRRSRGCWRGSRSGCRATSPSRPARCTG